MIRKINDPILDFLHFFLHLHKLNSFLIHSISRYEKLSSTMIEAQELISRMRPESEGNTDINVQKQDEKLKDVILKEISEDYYTLKSSEVILIYSRLESAITETVHLFFQDYEYKNLKEIENLRLTLLVL